MTRQSLPVLTYHSIAPGEALDAALFEKHLGVLATSGLPSLAPRELNDAPKGFLLTFDDGFADTWTHAFPLLEKYGLKATVFVITAHMGSGPPRNFGQIAFEGGSSQAFREAAGSSTGHPAFLRWSELRAMEQSGLVTISSHSHFHRMGWISDRITGFHLPPKAPAHWSLVQATGGDTRAGIPLYGRGSALGHRLYFDDPGLRDFLSAWLSRNGVSKYLDNKETAAVSNRLAQLTQSYRLRYPNQGRWESDGERERRTMDDIIRARRLLEDELGGRRDEFCLPWGHYDDTTLQILEKAGIKRIYTLDRGANPAGKIEALVKRFEPRPKGAWWLKSRLYIYGSVPWATIYRMVSGRR